MIGARRVGSRCDPTGQRWLGGPLSRTAAAALMAAALVASPARLQAQAAGKAAAPIDLTGYWVSFVTEDWRYRMVTPPKGDYRNVPVTRDALRMLNAWNPAADQAAGEACKSYGAAALMRVPGRFRITWQDDNTLRVDSDAGMQTRLLRFTSMPTGRPERTWQGTSAARWDARSLTVVTTNMRAGYLRKNGVPYSENATMTEYFDVAPHPSGSQLLVVTAVVVDPQYLELPYIVSTNFKKEADGSRWDPTPCSATW
jgi:hypothetical protein